MKLSVSLPSTRRLWERAEGILPKGGKKGEKEKSEGSLCGRGVAGTVWQDRRRPLMPSDLRASGCSLLRRQRRSPASEKNTLEMYLAFKVFPCFSPCGREQLLKRFSHPPHTVSQAGQLTRVLFFAVVLLCSSLRGTLASSKWM